MLTNLTDYLKEHKYPGRGILVGTTPDGEHGFIVYFIMGRSENSLNRIFVQDADGTVKTRAFEPAKLLDPTLVIYNAVRYDYDWQTAVVTNGTQTDALFNQSGFMSHTLSKWDYEPDELCTPRISALIFPDEYTISILKASNGIGSKSARYYFNYPRIPGEARFISTYDGNAESPRAFSGEPIRTAVITNDIKEFANDIWNALNDDHKISLYAAKMPLGGTQWNSDTVLTLIKNRHQQR
ncbi:MAG: IMP cyclohydrolase [Oscillospiraceae bacterium]|jgi:IMP cyclohydrolase|nr:IMP cyclohydrolase [Oscillospiraceae bacterium]